MGISEKALILELIPQREPIVMVDYFQAEEDGTSSTQLQIKEDNIFCDDYAFQECGLVEHIAQSAAARLGNAYLSKNMDIPIGYIGSVDKMKIISLPLIGELLKTRLKVIQELLGITLINAEVYSNDKLIAECKMKIFINEDK
jgi:3-hydroxymyristoyl/3-hydroxydecanoyl-(acyl carrier protein) dehydratase